MTKTEELINNIQLEVARALNQLDGLKEEVKKADLIKVRDSLSKLEVLNATVLLAQIATLQEQVTELKKWREESERRRWQLVAGVFLAVLAFSANLIVNFVRKPN